jgi:calcineurin-like phosphoesterase family protein
MIKSLYPQFQRWSATGSVYIISDTHFDDFDCKLMDPDWITPQEHMEIIKQNVRKGDTLIHLGDVGNPDYLDELKCYKVLITGNHDVLSKVASHFDEVYTGPLFIADRLVLSHEPLERLENFAMNIHGHVHDHTFRHNHTNLASNVYHFRVFNLGASIKSGLLSQIPNYHRVTIDVATNKKKLKEIINNNPITDFLEIDPSPIDPYTFFKREDFSNLVCDSCSNNPKNGGNGICFCTLGSQTIY